jgi:3-methyladenine DNA glycosylase Tag
MLQQITFVTSVKLAKEVKQAGTSFVGTTTCSRKEILLSIKML